MVELGDVFQPSDPRRTTWEGEVVKFKGAENLGINRRAILRCSDGVEREIVIKTLLRGGTRGFVRLPPRRAAARAEGSATEPVQPATVAPLTFDRRFVTDRQIVGPAGSGFRQVWRCAGCQATQEGLVGWRQILFSHAPSERFVSHLRDREHTVVCSDACAAEVADQWARRLAPQALAAARAEGVLDLLGRLETLAEPQWASVVRLSLGVVVDGRRRLSGLGSRVVALAAKPPVHRGRQRRDH